MTQTRWRPRPTACAPPVQARISTPDIKFAPGRRDNGTPPYGTCNVVDSTVADGWFIADTTPDDYGVAHLDCDVGRETGWLTLATQTDSFLLGRAVTVRGYPGDKPGGTMWTHKNQISEVAPLLVRYLNDTFGGQSGAPVYSSTATCQNCVYAIHKGGYPRPEVGPAEYNLGPRITAGVAGDLRGMAVQNNTPPSTSPVQSIDTRYTHTCALLDNGTVKCWGKNDYGQLGLGDTETRGRHTGQMGDSLPTVDLGTGRSATAITTGNVHTCALLDNDTVKCWGFGDFLGQGISHNPDSTDLGDEPGEMGDNLPTVDLGPGRTATAITSSNWHTCALLDNGTVKCWGWNTKGQLGLGDTEFRGSKPGEMGDNLPTIDLGTGRTATAITAGEQHHTCALLDNGQVRCWGRGQAGQLGLDEEMIENGIRGDEPGEMGDNLPTVDLGTDRTATAIAAGYAHSCGILDDYTIKCWGLNGNGHLGQGDSPAPHGNGPGTMGDNLPTVDLGTGRTATALSAGAHHTCAMLDNASVKCWGFNSNGQLGLEDSAHRGDLPGEMGDNLPTVDLGTGRTAHAIAAGYLHTCALLDNDTIKCWGHNTDGQLGQEDITDRGDGADEMGDNLPVVDLGDGCPAHSFSDVPAWLSDAADWAACTSHMTGYPNGSFRSDLNITRGQLARLLYRAAGSPSVAALPPHGLSDVPAWIDEPVRWLRAHNFMTGYTDNTFKPNIPISRGQVTRATFRVQGSPPGAPANQYPDVPNWLDSAVSWAAWDQDGAGPNPPLMSGYPNGTFGPDRNITRGQTARLTCRANTLPGTC